MHECQHTQCQFTHQRQDEDAENNPMDSKPNQVKAFFMRGPNACGTCTPMGISTAESTTQPHTSKPAAGE